MHGFFGGWVRAVTRIPVLTIVLVVLALGAAAVPAAQLRLALPDAGTLEPDAPGRVAYDLVDRHFGPGWNGPLVVTGQVIQSDDPVGLMDDLGDEIAALPGVVAVPLATPNEPGDTGIVQVIPDGAPDSEATAALVADLRAHHDRWLDEYGVELSVTGYTAAGIDISARLGGALLPFGLLVVGLSLVLLAMVFRSIAVPVTAAAGYALSVAAAFGLTTLVFVDGVGADALGVESTGDVISFMPIILMGVLFGLAMDYEVFLVSRMREAYARNGDAKAAVRTGFVGSARVVTAAAIIMFSVFVAFVPGGDASIQPIAFGLAAGVAIDAFLVRMTLIPALLHLLGRAAWTMPRSLDRALPHFDVEGDALAEELALADWPEPGAEDAIAAEGVRVAGAGRTAVDADAALDADEDPAAGLTVRLAPGEALVVTGGTAAARRALLLALGGRLPVVAGRLTVTGLAVPPRGASVRSRTAFVRLDAADPDGAGPAQGAADDDRRVLDRLVAALDAQPRILYLDGADAVGAPSIRADLRDALRRALAHAPGLALVVAAEDEHAARELLPAGTPVIEAALPSAADPARLPAGVP
ncbi:MMPL family transporter [Agromyces sp. MMS17-SY077]|uniref:MMPL family transporter n=1 Tax=Agromyces seonyuensis TaxID=2662446 RepID=A0A6I4NZQ7_9MICO|nr:MMPL family transporter [Agromyces seonyuensis]